MKGSVMDVSSVWWSILLAFLFVCTPLAQADEDVWKEFAHRKLGLSEEDVSSLEKNRILITNDAYKQIFSAYHSGRISLFITSDSLLNAYHVLYEESVLRMESAMASRLLPILRNILIDVDCYGKMIIGRPELVAAANKRAKLVTGIALKLMDDSFCFGDDELDGIVAEETERIIKAEGVGMPGWLGPPDESFSALDYSRYMPRGFYTQSETLAQYFRAVSWLQSIPFRVNNDEELLSILILGKCGGMNWNDYFGVYRQFIGVHDDWDLMTAHHVAGDQLVLPLDLYSEQDALQKIRVSIVENAAGYGGESQIFDQIRRNSKPPKAGEDLNFRIISAAQTPSAILFERITDIRKFQRSYPDGLEVAIALGSDFAQENLKDTKKVDVLDTIHSCHSFFNGDNSLYQQYLNVLKTLVDDPEPDAPDFMKNQAWQAKSCNTVLAGWAQLRHTWALQAKQNALAFGGSYVPDGFVEPEPEFYSRMAGLAAATSQLLMQSGAFEPDPGLLEDMADTLERISVLIGGASNGIDFRNKLSVQSEKGQMDTLFVRRLLEEHTPPAKKWSPDWFLMQKQWLDLAIQDIRNGKIDNYPEIKKRIMKDGCDFHDLWGKLEDASLRLELIAHKQLRHVELNERETEFIKQYKWIIAEVMLHGSDAYLWPRDDAPKVVDVFANPKEGGYLHVGVARPRKMYVLYPWKGETVLCEGAVMPYCEFVNATRLTDEVWRTMLDSDEHPPAPEWISPIVTARGLKKPTVLLGD